MKNLYRGLAGLLLLLAACRGDVYRKLRLELPPYSPVKLEEFQEILITDFLVTRTPEGFDLNREIRDYFRAELERKFKGNILVQPFSVENEEALENEEAWKVLHSPSASRLIMTGKAGLIQETRKAILGRPARRPEEDRLSPARNIEERRVFTLELTVILLRPETGQPLLKKDFKETLTYTNLAQRVDFAFHDLAQRVRVKLFRPLLGEERIQERYLLLRS